MARNNNPPPGYAVVDALPEGMLDSTPAPSLVGPKRTVWGRMTSRWQVVKHPHYGHAAGYPAWSFQYIRKDPSPIVTEEDHGVKSGFTVVAVERGGSAPGLAIRPRGAMSRMMKSTPRNSLSIDDAAFERRHFIYGEPTAGFHLTPAVRSVILSAPPNTNIDIGGRWLIVLMGGNKDQAMLTALAERLATALPPLP